MAALGLGKCSDAPQIQHVSGGDQGGRSRQAWLLDNGAQKRGAGASWVLVWGRLRCAHTPHHSSEARQGHRNMGSGGLGVVIGLPQRSEGLGGQSH